MVSLKTAGKFRENGTQLVDLGYHASRVFIDSKGSRESPLAPVILSERRFANEGPMHFYSLAEIDIRIIRPPIIRMRMHRTLRMVRRIFHAFDRHRFVGLIVFGKLLDAL
jgi:hypothetical protein